MAYESLKAIRTMDVALKECTPTYLLPWTSERYSNNRIKRIPGSLNEALMCENTMRKMKILNATTWKVPHKLKQKQKKKNTNTISIT